MKRSSKLDFRAPSIPCIKRKDTCSLIRPLKARRAVFRGTAGVSSAWDNAWLTVTNVKTGDRGALASLLARAPRQGALGSSAASRLQLLTQSHSPTAYLPKARPGPSLQSYRSSTPACKRHTSAPSLGPKTSPILHTEVLDYITCPRPDGGLKAQGSNAQHTPSLCLMPSPPKHSPYMPSFPG